MLITPIHPWRQRSQPAPSFHSYVMVLEPSEFNLKPEETQIFVQDLEVFSNFLGFSFEFRCDISLGIGIALLVWLAWLPDRWSHTCMSWLYWASQRLPILRKTVLKILSCLCPELAPEICIAAVMVLHVRQPHHEYFFGFSWSLRSSALLSAIFSRHHLPCLKSR